METEKSRRKLYIFTVLCIVFIMSLGTGYALFQETLYIGGMAATIGYTPSTYLPTTPIILDTTNNLYSDIGSKATIAPCVTETWEDDAYTATIDRVCLRNRFNWAPYSNTLGQTNTSFTNPTNYPYTNGTLEYANYDNNFGIDQDEYNAMTPEQQAEIDAWTRKMKSFYFQDVTLNSETIAPGNNSIITYYPYISASGIMLYSDTVYDPDIKISYDLPGTTKNFIIRYVIPVVTPPDDNLFFEDGLLENNHVYKDSNGYYLFRFQGNSGSYIASGTYLTYNASSSITRYLKDHLEAGKTYQVSREIENDGTNKDVGKIIIRNKKSAALFTLPAGTGVATGTFTFTQEQIDSIGSVLVYPGNGNTRILKYIRITEVTN